MSLRDLAALAVKYCEKIGADEAEAFGQSQQTVEVVLERAEIQSERVKTQQGIGVRIIKKKKLGFAFTSTLSKSSIEECCRNANSLANVSIPNPDWVSLPLRAKLPRAPSGIYDREAASLGGDGVLRLVMRAYDEAKGYDKRVDIDDGKFSLVSSEVAICNSHGVQVDEKGTLLDGFLICMAKEHGEASSMAYEYDITRSVKDFSPERIGKVAAEKALASLRPKAVESFVGKVILDSDPAATILMQPILSSVNADNVQRKRSLWAEKLGEEVASHELTVTDDGLLSKGMGSSSFDFEGVPRQKTPVIARGKLRNFLYNSFTANKEGKKSTGNAYRDGYYMLLVIYASNLIVGTGAKKLEKMVAGIDKGIIVRRFSGNVRPDSGEFSGIAKQASYIEKGMVKYPLKETMISGNAFQAMKNIIEIGSETRPTFIGGYVPPITIDKINIISK
jgi:PmbA protein